MTKKNNSSDTFWGAVGMLILITFLFSWLSIPSKDTEVSGFEISSLTFANGVFDGWADDLAIKLFHSDSSYDKSSAKASFRSAILRGERDHPTATAIFNVLGAFFSIGGLIAVWVARSADNAKQAFNFGFWAEIIESVVFHAGYSATVGKVSLSGVEVAITLVVAVIMGTVAVQVNKRYHAAPTSRATA